MAAPSRSGWEANGITPEERFCRKCGAKLTLTMPGGFHVRGYPERYVEHNDCDRAAKEKL